MDKEGEVNEAGVEPIKGLQAIKTVVRGTQRLAAPRKQDVPTLCPKSTVAESPGLTRRCGGKKKKKKNAQRLPNTLLHLCNEMVQLNTGCIF